jgi:putative ABC transport system substrate-binding protein
MFMSRRAIVVQLAAGLAAFTCAPGRAAWRSTPGAPRRIGWLWMSPWSPAMQQQWIDPVVARLQRLGYDMGGDVILDVRFAGGDPARLPPLARELAGLKPAAIIATNSAVRAVMQATRTIPIVMHAALNPVETGLVSSLASPDSNVTGTTYSQPEVGGKRIEILKAAAPSITRVALLWNDRIPGMGLHASSAERTARELGIQLQHVQVRKPGDFHADKVERLRTHALSVTHDPVFSNQMHEVVGFARQRKLPSTGSVREFASEGGLMALTPDLDELHDNVTDYLHRFLSGTRPGDLPVRQPSRFHLTLNQTTADAIGLRLPDEFRLRIHEVIV